MRISKSNKMRQNHSLLSHFLNIIVRGSFFASIYTSSMKTFISRKVYATLPPCLYALNSKFLNRCFKSNSTSRINNWRVERAETVGVSSDKWLTCWKIPEQVQFNIYIIAITALEPIVKKEKITKKDLYLCTRIARISGTISIRWK